MSGIVIKGERRQLDELIESELSVLAWHKHQVERAQRAYEEQESKVIGLFSAQRIKTHDTGTVKATLVARERARYNEVGLKKALGAKLWNRVTKKVLDKTKLEKLVNTGEISLDIVAVASELVADKPYIRLSSSQPE